MLRVWFGCVIECAYVVSICIVLCNSKKSYWMNMHWFAMYCVVATVYPYYR